MTQGSSYPLAGIKIGQTPAHRLSTPTPKLASGVSKTDMTKTDAPKKSSPASGSAGEPERAATTSVSTASVSTGPVTTGPVTTESAKTTGATPDTSTDGASKSTEKPEPSTTPKQPSQDSNEVEVTTSDQISEHGLPTNGRSTHSSSSTPATGTGTGRSGAPDRRTAMGVASVRIAGRLTQNELGSRTGDIRTPDTSVGPDELLQLLGEYLVSGGLQNPEVHVRSNGQTIVLDLLNPAKGYR